MHWPQDLGESPKEASEVSKRGERLRVFFLGASPQLRVLQLFGPCSPSYMVGTAIQGCVAA